MADTPDVGRYAPFPPTAQHPLRRSDIALQINGRFVPTRAGLERLALREFGIRPEYVEEQDSSRTRLVCALYHGESLLGCAVAAYESSAPSIATHAQARTDALREALQQFAPQVLEHAAAIIAAGER